ncbi:hypothetical protein NCC49_005225 [Naganishia albida]|nr:hypothetical protein NCC49_005225 [Naganishia albida]
MSSPVPVLTSSKDASISILEQDRNKNHEKKDEHTAGSSQSSINEDDKQMAAFGYKSQLARRWHSLESFAVSFCAIEEQSSWVSSLVVPPPLGHRA